MAAVAKSLNTTYAIVTYLCDCVTAAFVGRDAVRYVVRDGRLVLARPAIGELCVARRPCWKGRCVTLSRGLQPVTAPNLSPTSTLDISANGGDGTASQFITSLAASLDKDVYATTREVLAMMSAVSGRVCQAPLTVTHSDFSQTTYLDGDVVVLTRTRSPPPSLEPCTRTRSLPEVRRA
jgi:hypothetical protein